MVNIFRLYELEDRERGILIVTGRDRSIWRDGTFFELGRWGTFLSRSGFVVSVVAIVSILFVLYVMFGMREEGRSGSLL
jgi:hypothetical protein